MAVSRVLRRLMRVRELEEEQRRLALENANGDLNRLHETINAAQERGRQGRRRMGEAIGGGDLEGRLANMEEMRTSERFSQVLTPRIELQEAVVSERREEFLEKRLERRQAETLIEESAAREALEEGRRAQMGMDDWYSNKLYRESFRAAEKEMPVRGEEPFFLEDFQNPPIE